MVQGREECIEEFRLRPMDLDVKFEERIEEDVKVDESSDDEAYF